MPEEKKKRKAWAGQAEYNRRVGYASQKRYNAEKVMRVHVNLNRETDADIIAALAPDRPPATQLKELIRAGFEAKKIFANIDKNA